MTFFGEALPTGALAKATGSVLSSSVCLVAAATGARRRDGTARGARRRSADARGAVARGDAARSIVEVDVMAAPRRSVLERRLEERF